VLVQVFFRLEKGGAVATVQVFDTSIGFANNAKAHEWFVINASS